MDITVAFIGGGNMAAALIGGLMADGFRPDRVLVVDPNRGQLERLASAYEVRTATEADRDIGQADVVVWAVKPQALQAAAKLLAAAAPRSLHVSIAAGVRLQDLTRWLGTERVVRAMPNTAALVGAGVTGLLAGSAVMREDQRLVERLLSAAGATFWVDTDEAMNAVTALSGSGPAYLFHFLEGFQRAAEQVGFDPLRARGFVLQVVNGALRQAMQGDEPFGLLRKRVTSKQGTTEAALSVLDRYATQRALSEAIQAALDRGRELGAELGADQD